jgi:hypothetical protein
MEPGGNKKVHSSGKAFSLQVEMMFCSLFLVVGLVGGAAEASGAGPWGHPPRPSHSNSSTPWWRRVQFEVEDHGLSELRLNGAHVNNKQHIKTITITKEVNTIFFSSTLIC